jgi:hypothetical protein
MKFNSTKFNSMKFNCTKFNKELNKTILKNLNSNTLIVIILIILLIVLGVYWYYKRNTIIEGNLETVTNSLSGFMDTLKTETGMSFDSSKSAELLGLMDKLKDITGSSQDNGIYNVDYPYATAADDSSANLINTTPSTYPGKTFLVGGRDRFSDGFCETYGSSLTLDLECNKLTAEHCNETSCCVFLNGKKCVAGSKDGPTVMVDTLNGGDIDYTYYSHKNTCYGTCEKEMTTESANPCSSYTNDSTSISKSCINRYWKQTVCGESVNNPNYITDDLVKEWKNHSRAAIKEKIKDIATDEIHYAKCYGTNETKWPAPCIGTSPTSFGLSQRCMTDLFKKTGCTYDGTVNQAFVEEHKLEPKSAMINKFTGYFNGKDIVSKQKCYGPDEMAWPSPCKGMTSDTLLKDVPKECVMRTWVDKLKSQCTSEHLDKFYDVNDNLIVDGVGIKSSDTFKIVKEMPEEHIYIIINEPVARQMCYGSNPNNWPGIVKVTPDPCEGITAYTKRPAGNFIETQIRDVPLKCRNRISDLLVPTGRTIEIRENRDKVGTIINDETIAEYKSELRDINTNEVYGKYLRAIMK